MWVFPTACRRTQREGSAGGHPARSVSGASEGKDAEDPGGRARLIARARTIQPSTELVAASDGGTCTEFFPGRGRKRAVRTGPKPPRAQEWKERWTPGPCPFLGRGNGKSRRLRALIPHGRRNGRSVPAPRNRKPPQRVSSSPDARGSSSSRRNR